MSYLKLEKLLSHSIFSSISILVIGALCNSPNAFAKAIAISPATPKPSPTTSIRPEVSPSLQPMSINELCKKLNTEVKRLKWAVNPCYDIDWKEGARSVRGIPIIYGEWGNPQATNVTLILSMVHGDEVTPLYLGLELAKWANLNVSPTGDTKIVIAPLVNPDSFFNSPRTRVNANGVDVNRNFHTNDWGTKALQTWRTRFKKNPRRFPGHSPNSEPETKFQVDLINKVNPQKILSIHAPLNVFDYDGPSTLALERFPKEYVKECLKLRSRLKAVSSGFFPGSLGNYSGRELGIPTLTLELPSADPKKAKAYWDKFSTGIHEMIEFKMPEKVSLNSKDEARIHPHGIES